MRAQPLPMHPAVDPIAADAELMRRIGQRDGGAFREVYDAHQLRVYRLAYGIVLDADEAREVLQEVFVQLHRVANRWKPKARIGTWLYRVTVTQALRWRRRVLRFWQAESLPPAEDSPEDKVAAQQSWSRVGQAMAELTPRTRAVMTLVLEHDLGPAEVAELMGMKPEAVRVSLHRGRKQLRQALGEDNE